MLFVLSVIDGVLKPWGLGLGAIEEANLACSLGLVLIVYAVVMVLYAYWIVFYE